MSQLQMTQEQKDLASNNYGLVFYAVNKYLSSMKFDFDDMISIGSYGLCKAAMKYDPDNGMTFSTYAIKVIIRTIHREAQYAMRMKRGGGKLDASLDHSYSFESKDDGNDKLLSNILIDESVDVENEALNKVVCEDVWKLVPFYVELENCKMSDREYCVSIGKSRSFANAKKRRQLDHAKKYLAEHGIYESA